MNCRHCNSPLEHTFLDLGFAPPSNAYLGKDDLQQPEVHFPLRLFVCNRCWLVQTQDYARREELFSRDYAYFSSVSTSWLEHAAQYSRMVIRRLSLDANSFVVEVASNDGYLLRNFVAAGIPCLGIEPTDSTADAAERLGVPVLRKFFGEDLARELARQGRQADLVIGNNVYAHVPDINDFTRGLAELLRPQGTVTLEFPHLMRLIEHNQFDTVYHEHFSYLSLHTVMRIFDRAGLRVYDVEELSTHGGSIRVYGCRSAAHHAQSAAVASLLRQESAHGLQGLEAYTGFQQRAVRVKHDLLRFLLEQATAKKRVAGYGAAAKGNTLLNFSGVAPDLLPFVCDAAPSKQGKFLPGSHIPVLSPEALEQHRPDWVLILPWNIAEEVVAQQSRIARWGGRFVVAIPTMRIIG